MALRSYIIRFPDRLSRNKFRAALAYQRGLTPEQVVCTEVFPDIIVRDISEAVLATMKRLADPKARFYEDIQYEAV